MVELYKLLLENHIDLKIIPFFDKPTLAFIFSKDSKQWSIQADLSSLEKAEDSVYINLTDVLRKLIDSGYFEK